MTATSSFSQRLLHWFRQGHRDLPWRHTTDPWAIWVSEIMLQQTRVETVREPYQRFLQSYPDPASLAGISDDELMLAWRGLGYYRRARLLRDGARRVVETHGGVVPGTIAELRELPGIGPYTLGAVGSIAFGHPEPAVDGNVERVASRHRGLDAPIGTSPARRAIRAVVVDWLDEKNAGDFNQALMELGATVCTPTSPGCGDCPVASDCIAKRDRRTGELPVKKAQRAAVEVTARVLLALRHGKRGQEALGYRIPADQPNAGQIELPGPGVLVDCDPDDLAETVQKRFSARLETGATVAEIRHGITHHRITLHAHMAKSVAERGRLRWFTRDGETPWTTVSRKVFAQTNVLEA
ncbi:MAG: A/G-specific adenine glycosylase [Planctomycetota bacterium]